MAKAIHHPTLGEKTYEQIRALILSGKIRPGERLHYNRLVSMLGVSQTPIKEAFTRLEDDGFVVTITRKGTFARELSAREIREAFEIREMLEALAARRACGQQDGEALKTLNSINARFIRAARKRDVKACTREDYAFHEALIAMSGNEKLRELMNKMNYHLMSIAQSSPRFLGIAGKYSAMHAQIIRAIEARDPETAEKLVRRHIRYGMEEVLPAEAD
jgi:DNA-binding GntR family transcriptional regulator